MWKKTRLKVKLYDDCSLCLRLVYSWDTTTRWGFLPGSSSGLGVSPRKMACRVWNKLRFLGHLGTRLRLKYISSAKAQEVRFVWQRCSRALKEYGLHPFGWDYSKAYESIRDVLLKYWVLWGIISVSRISFLRVLDRISGRTFGDYLPLSPGTWLTAYTERNVLSI